jgi:hypothetical protein
MQTTFLDYYKMILHKVSFDRHLFLKEYGKALTLLSPPEVKELNRWLETESMLASMVRDSYSTQASSSASMINGHYRMTQSDRASP